MCILHILISDAFGDYYRHQKLSYQTTPGDEVEDMFVLLHEVKKQIPSITAVSSGAIASNYQRLRVESVCSRLGLVSLAYLWKQDQSLLLQEMVMCILLTRIIVYQNSLSHILLYSFVPFR